MSEPKRDTALSFLLSSAIQKRGMSIAGIDAKGDSVDSGVTSDDVGWYDPEYDTPAEAPEVAPVTVVDKPAFAKYGPGTKAATKVVAPAPVTAPVVATKATAPIVIAPAPVTVSVVAPVTAPVAPKTVYGVSIVSGKYGKVPIPGTGSPKAVAVVVPPVVAIPTVTVAVTAAPPLPPRDPEEIQQVTIFRNGNATAASAKSLQAARNVKW